MAFPPVDSAPTYRREDPPPGFMRVTRSDGASRLLSEALLVEGAEVLVADALRDLVTRGSAPVPVPPTERVPLVPSVQVRDMTAAQLHDLGMRAAADLTRQQRVVREKREAAGPCPTSITARRADHVREAVAEDRAAAAFGGRTGAPRLVAGKPCPGCDGPVRCDGWGAPYCMRPTCQNSWAAGARPIVQCATCGERFVGSHSCAGAPSRTAGTTAPSAKFTVTSFPTTRAPGD